MEEKRTRKERTVKGKKMDDHVREEEENTGSWFEPQ